jgi:transglutaminase-like putative cysteine protease
MAAGGRDIVDRTEILCTLDDECLQKGVSTAIVARHKMGKSFLLRHLHSRWPQITDAPDSLFCFVTIDNLKETLGDNEPLSDSVFYRYIVRKLASQLEQRILADRQRWQRNVNEDEALLASIGAGDLHDALTARISDLRGKLAGLPGLQSVLTAMQTLLGRPRPVEKLDVVRLVDDLNDFGKRVVFLLDDLHRFLEQQEFSDDLYQFVRGGDTTGSIVALFSMPVRPMDLRLHSKKLAKGREALLNYIRANPLPPFSDRDVSEYLKYLFPDETLTWEEGRYLFRLGGGSPQFLLIAYDLFVSRQHPTRAERKEFEAELAKAFRKGFQEIWEWCGEDEKRVLRQKAQFSIPPDTIARRNLLSSGYLIPDPSPDEPRMFSSLFIDFVREQIRVEAKAELTFDVFPTALYFAQPRLAEPLVTFVLDNPTTELVRVKVECELQNYSERAEEIVTLNPGQEKVQKMLHVDLRRDKIEALKGADNGQAWYQATLLAPGGDQKLAGGTKTLRMLPRDHFTFARFNQDAQDQIDHSWLITAWVTTRPGEKFDNIRALARQKCTLDGYQSDRAGVEQQVKCLYAALKEQGLRYEASPPGLDWDANPEQRVRLPKHSLEERAANCLDATVLFASLLEASGLDALIFLMPGHALAGWKESREGSSVRFLDIGGMAGYDFEEACDKGQKLFRDAEQLRDESAAWLKQDPPIVKDLRRFSVLIDVREARKWRGVVPFD